MLEKYAESERIIGANGVTVQAENSSVSTFLSCFSRLHHGKLMQMRMSQY
jgi:hypothetical protein